MEINMNMKKLFKKFEANYDMENLTEAEMISIIQNPNAFSRKKVTQQKPKTKKRHKRNRRK